MAKDNPGADNLSGAVSGKTGLADMKPDQLAALGGTPDPLDSEDFSKADFGNEVTTPKDTESQSDDDSKEKDDPEKGQDDDKDPEKGQDDEADESKKDEENDESEESVDEDDKSDDQDDDAGDKGASKGDDADAEDDAEDSDESEETDDEKPAKGKDQRVPLDRFRDVNKRMRAAEKRVEQLEREIEASKGKEPKADEEKPYDFDKAEAEYQDLVLDGKKADAIAKRREIRAAERAAYQKETAETSRLTVTSERDSELMDALAAKYEASYPEMDENHPDFNPEVNLEVEALLTGYLNQGLDPPKAFAKALKRATENFDLKPADERGDPEAEKGGKGKGKAKTDEQNKKAAEKGKAKVNKAKKAPPNTNADGARGDEGGDSVPKSVDEMSEEEFNALPKSTIARMRGDFV